MRVPLAFREQVHKIGAQVLAGDVDRVLAADLLERWIFKNAPHIAHAVVRDWGRDKLDNWLRVQLREEANRKLRPPAEEGLFDILDQMPDRIEIGIGKLIDRLDARRPHIIAWRKQSDVKAANATGFQKMVHRCADYLLAQMSDDAATVRDVLQNVRAETVAAARSGPSKGTDRP